jgi:hypothetical protein
VVVLGGGFKKKIVNIILLITENKFGSLDDFTGTQVTFLGNSVVTVPGQKLCSGC